MRFIFYLYTLFISMNADNRVWLYSKNFFERIKNEKLKYNLLQAVPFWIASLITGFIAVLYTKLFAGAEGVTAFLLHSRQLHIYHSFSVPVHPWYLLFIAPVLYLVAYLIVQRYAPYSRGSGIPQVMAAIDLANPKENHKVHKLLSIKVIAVKVASSLLMVMGGGAIGREGPTIQIAGSVFRTVNQWIPASWPKISRRNMIMTGAAAGLAAAFNTPLGGIVFAVEELTKTHISYYRTAIFSAVIIAGLTAQYYLGPYLYLGYPDVSNLSSFVFTGVVLVAVITGIMGSLMCKAILAIFRWKRNFTPFQNIIFVIGCSLIMTSIALFINTDILGSGKELMKTVLFTADKRVAWYVPVFRTIGPLFSFTTGAAGGVFAPALSAGASFGAITAEWFHLSAVNSNLLILAGMVGFLTGVTRTPFTSAILVLEMTNSHNVIFHLMLAAMVASICSLIVDKHSFYDHLKVQYIRSLEEEELTETAVAAPAAG
jgi:H+/Cl- antiporter ClcA